MNNYLTYSQLQGNQPLNNKSMDKTSHYEKEKPPRDYPHAHGQPLTQMPQFSDVLAHSPARQSHSIMAKEVVPLHPAHPAAQPVKHTAVDKIVRQHRSDNDHGGEDCPIFSLYKTDLQFSKYIAATVAAAHQNVFPVEFDWRHHVSLPVARHQGTCANNFAVTVVSALQDRRVVHGEPAFDYTPCMKCHSAEGNAAQLVSQLASSTTPRCSCLSKIQATVDNVRWLTDIDAIKQAIVTQGPVIAGMLVYSNFLSGHFGEHGIYLDRVVTHHPHTKFASPASLVGAITVVIVGWGVAADVQTSPFTYESVPYWICRNTWGPQWGPNDGYFKIATHRHNKHVQLERPFHYKQAQCGGVITFDLRPLAKESAWSTYGIPIAVAVLLVVMLYGVKLKLKSVRRR